jgi:hypothetical protein
VTDAATIRRLLDRAELAPAEDFGPAAPVWEEYLRRLDGLPFYITVVPPGVRAVLWAASDAWAVRCYGGRAFEVRFPDGFDPGEVRSSPDLSEFGLPVDLSWKSVTEAQMVHRRLSRPDFTASYSFPHGKFVHLDVRLHRFTIHYGEADILPDHQPVAITMPFLRGEIESQVTIWPPPPT